MLTWCVGFATVATHPYILSDRFLNSHAKWYLREVRIKAYAQFLESYKSVTAASMAKSFGVGVEFLDRELARFIAAGRIHAKIDKVRHAPAHLGCCCRVALSATYPVACPQMDGIIETNRPDAKNAQYSVSATRKPRRWLEFLHVVVLIVSACVRVCTSPGVDKAR